MLFLGVIHANDNVSPKIKIKNTDQFINYFKGAQSVVEYFRIKDSIENFSRRIKNDKLISEEIKVKLSGYYTVTQQLSEKLYNKIRDDLMSSQKRKEIKEDPEGYTKELIELFSEIQKSSDEYYIQYKNLTEKDKGLVGFVIKLIKFFIPIVKDFLKESLTDAVKSLLDRKLKPLIVITPWSELKANS